MKLSFYGAASEVTGSNYLLETSQARVAIDCGAFQGGKDSELKNVAPFLYAPSRVDALILTHAHLDHVGRLAKLVRDGFRGPIWCTPATKELAELIMLDAAKIMSHDELKFGDEPLYGEADVYQALGQCRTIDYGVKTEVAPGVEVRFVDAGHILGSASVELWADGKKVLFSGDIGNAGAPIIRDPVTVAEADFVICESTYGGRQHESADQRQAMLEQAIRRAVEKRGPLLIPAFALERTQELLHTLDHLAEVRKLGSLPLFLDSPLAIRATEVFRRHPEYFDKEALADIRKGRDFFNVPHLNETETVEQSKRIAAVPPPKVIIAGSGMMTGGRILHHLKAYISDPRTTILFVGYQAEGTLGRRLLDGVDHVDLFHEPHEVKAELLTCEVFSAHADHDQLMRWLGAITSSVGRVFLTHGEPTSAKALGNAVTTTLKHPVHIPRFGEHATL
ncbi:MAG: MBL fold metallo-hydrolase [Patescibacteria group bacterium]|jgi:metallo-beta-lactamase family protein